MAGTDCGRARERIHDLVDGRLPPGEAEELRRHLAGCPGCAREEEEILLVGRFLREAAAGAAADPRLAALWTRVRAGIEERRDWEEGRRAWLHRFLWIPAAAALAVLFFVFYPARVGRPPLAPGDFRVSVESLESEAATVALSRRNCTAPARRTTSPPTVVGRKFEANSPANTSRAACPSVMRTPAGRSRASQRPITAPRESRVSASAPAKTPNGMLRSACQNSLQSWRESR